MLQTVLFGVSPRDLFTYAAVAAVVALVGAAANYVPARRAARVDPNQALRFE
jgi:ABC-type antimicrobial peptide transport system permease subunit